MNRFLLLAVGLLLARSCAGFDPFGALKQNLPQFTVTFDSSSADASNDACTAASECAAPACSRAVRAAAHGRSDALERGQRAQTTAEKQRQGPGSVSGAHALTAQSCCCCRLCCCCCLCRPCSDAYTRPQLARVSVCAKSKAVSANGAGLVTAFSNSSMHLTNQASTACAEAVGQAVKGLCEGGDPLAAITSISSTCASALVELQASSISGVDISPATNVPLLSPSKKAYTVACASGCSNAQTSAEAVAQSSACAWMAASKGCNSVRVALSSQTYAQAFIKTTAQAWSNACSLGFGKSTSVGTAQAATTADVLSKAVGEVVAAACSNCDTCKCKPLPPGWTYDKSNELSKAAATTVAGQFTMAKAISQAVGAYCDSDKSTKAIQAGVNATINTMAVIMAKVMVKTTANASASGVAMSCAGGYVSQQIRVRGVDMH